MQKALPLIPAGGAIVLNASIVSVQGVPSFSVYSASKAAVRSFARGWTNDLKDRKIRVNVVSPGPVDTPGLSGLAQTEEHKQALYAQLASDVPLGRLGQPEEIAKAAGFTLIQCSYDRAIHSRQAGALAEEVRQRVEAAFAPVTFPCVFGTKVEDGTFVIRIGVQFQMQPLGLNYENLVIWIGAVHLFMRSRENKIREDAPGFSERNLGAQPRKQGSVHFLLQLAHLGAHRRLRPVAGLRRLGETLQADDLEKRVELVKIHTLRALVTTFPVFYQNFGCHQLAGRYN